MAYNFTQPMAMRIDEVVSGVKADLAIKVFGDDSRCSMRSASRCCASSRGCGRGRRADGNARAWRSCGTSLTTAPALARYGLNVADVERGRAAIGGIGRPSVIDGQRRYTVALRLPDVVRARCGRACGEYSADGARRRAGDARRGGARGQATRGTGNDRAREAPAADRGQSQRPRPRPRQLRRRGPAADRAARDAAAGLLPVEWGGQFENQQRASAGWRWSSRSSLALIFAPAVLDLPATSAHALLVFAGVPFACVGGIARAVAARPAVLESLGGGRLHRAVRRRRARTAWCW